MSEMDRKEDMDKVERGNFDPPPTYFTHETTQDTPYYLNTPLNPYDGIFPNGTKLLMYLETGDNYPYVVSGEGIFAAVQRASLRRL